MIKKLLLISFGFMIAACEDTYMEYHPTTLFNGLEICCRASCYHTCNLNCSNGETIQGAANFIVNYSKVCRVDVCRVDFLNGRKCEEFKQ